MLKELDELIEATKDKGYTLDQETLSALRTTALEQEIIVGAVAEKGRRYSIEEADTLTAHSIDADEFLANPQAFLKKIEADDEVEG